MRKRKEPGCCQPGSWKQAGGGSEFDRRRGLEGSRQPLDQIAAERRGPIGFVRDIIDVEAEGDRRFARRDDIARAEIEARPFGEFERVGQVDLLLAGLDQAAGQVGASRASRGVRSEEHTSELQSLMRISYAVFCLKKK